MHYALTPVGHELWLRVSAPLDWWDQHSGDIAESRHRYDAATAAPPDDPAPAPPHPPGARGLFPRVG